MRFFCACQARAAAHSSQTLALFQQVRLKSRADRFAMAHRARKRVFIRPLVGVTASTSVGRATFPPGRLWWGRRVAQRSGFFWGCFVSLFGCSVCGCVGCSGAVGGAASCLSVVAVSSASGVSVGAAALVLSCLASGAGASGAGASPSCAGCGRACSVASLLSPSPLWRGARCVVCGRGVRVCGSGRVVPVGALGCGVAGCACGAPASGAPASGAAPPRR